MTLADLGNIGEFLGSVAVLISIIYLAFQIKQNTLSIERSENNAAQNHWSQLRQLLMNNTELSRILARVLRDETEFDEVETIQLVNMLSELFHICRHQYDRNNQGFGTLDDWNEQTKPFIKDLMSKKYVAIWWEQNKFSFPEYFREDLDAD